MEYYSDEKTALIEAEIDALEDIVDERNERFDKDWFKQNCSFTESRFSEYQTKKERVGGEELKKLKRLYLEIRMNKKPIFQESSNIGDVMLLEHFVECVKIGGFIDYDGFGIYMKDGQESDIEIYPSDVKKGNLRKDFDTIMWFNH